MARLTRVGNVAELDQKWATVRDKALALSRERTQWLAEVHALLRRYEPGTVLGGVTERGFLAPFMVVEVDGQRHSYIVTAVEHCGKTVQSSEDGQQVWAYERSKQRLLKRSRALLKEWNSLGEEMGIWMG